MMILKPLKLPPLIIESNTTAFDAPAGAFTAGDAAASHRRRRHFFILKCILKVKKTEEKKKTGQFCYFRVLNPKHKK